MPSQRWHTLTVEETATALTTDTKNGLDSPEAARRLDQFGRNELAQARGRSRFKMLLDQFANLLVGVLIGAAIMSAMLGELSDAIAIMVIVAINGVIGFFQERRAADALDALRKLSVPNARVRRHGVPAIVPAPELVPGDLVMVEAGDKAPADLRLAQASEVRAVEAALTGESEPVEKTTAALNIANAALGDRTNMLFAGTIVAAGTVEGIVVGTGSNTELGKIATLVQQADEGETPLQARLKVFGRWLVVGSGAVVVLVIILGLIRGVGAIEMLLTGISLAVAAVPEGLPAVVTIALALGVRRLARRGTLIRKLASVETLGCTTVICSDKTGTLTVGQMTVRTIRTIEDNITVEGEGYRLEGELTREGARYQPGATDSTYRALWAAAACSTARLVKSEGSVEIAGDPTEGALLVAAAKAGITQDMIDQQEPVIVSHPFDSERKRMSIVRKAESGTVAYVKGAPEAILPRCVNVLTRTGVQPLPSDTRTRLVSINDEMARRGMRVLAVACRNLQADEDAESELTFLGLAGMQDPPRAEVKASVQACIEAGIRPVMITGDHPRTALAIAQALGIASEDNEVMSGTELDGLSESGLISRVESIRVYARVSPEHKLRIVRAWKARGAVVAMTGDGVNDAPALKGADIGVAMGKSGTDVAKDASAMVITDDNFATIVSAIEEGRATFENIRKTLLYLLSGNVAEILIMAIAVLAGWPLPLVPIQLLWINLVTDGLPALALVTDPPDKGVLRAPPRKPGQEIVDQDFITWMLVSGALMAACTIAGFLYGLYEENSLERARTYAFSTLVMGEVLRAFASRSRTKTLWEVGLWSNVRLAMVALFTIGLQIYSHHSGILEGFLKTGELGTKECLGVLILAAIPVTVLEVFKLMRRAFAPKPNVRMTR
ncbi:MAG: cation-translocating P-type ATPase [Planctomycetaceae bacterium]|nr:cation-translocating P-type ATPase [Planctomycetaceae bacterium]